MNGKIFTTIVGACFLLTVIVSISGCFGGSKVPFVVDQFALSYPPIAVSSAPAVHEAIRIERFSVAQIFNTTAMIYSPGAYRFDGYERSRWRVGPGDMVSDFLIRDLRSASLFGGVFPYSNDEPVRYILEGTVQEFLESDAVDRAEAVFAVHITLLDTRERELTKRTRFQKTYRYVNVLDERSPEALAKGMSVAMSHFSADLAKDMDTTLKEKTVR